MRKIWYAIVLLVLAACSNSGKQVSEKENNDKNVLFIVIDDLTTTLGCFDHPVVKTPNIDRLASHGVLFTGAYCNFAVCGPSRGSFLTGLRPQTIGIVDNNTPLQDKLGDRVTLPYLFKQNGFHTAGLGKIFHRYKPGYGDPKA